MVFYMMEFLERCMENYASKKRAITPGKIENLYREEYAIIMCY